MLDRPRRDVSSWLEITLAGEPVRHHFVEIRDSSRGHKLVTLIEILSPSNKRPGPDRDAYRAKQDGGARQRREPDRDRPVAGGRARLAGPQPLGVRRADRAAARLPRAGQPGLEAGAGGVGYEVFPCGLREWLPCLPVPLKEGEAAVPLDLQFVANRAYAGGPYLKGAVDYAKPPDPPLAAEDAAWAEDLLRGAGPERGPRGGDPAGEVEDPRRPDRRRLSVLNRRRRSPPRLTLPPFPPNC